MIDIGDALELLETVVEEGGANHYASCQYVNPTTNQPECIAGRALFMAGVTVEQLKSFLAQGVRSLYNLEILPIELSLGAVEVLQAAQSAQDGLNGYDRPHSWGEALGEAYKAAEKLSNVLPAELADA